MPQNPNDPNTDKLAAIDAQLADLIQSRAKLVISRGDSGQGESGSTEIPSGQIQAILRHVSSACDALIRPAPVAFLGPFFSYSHLATLKHFGESIPTDPVASIPAVFDAVGRDQLMRGVVPIENSTDGRIVDTLGRLIKADVTIVGEVSLPIHHNLVSKSERNDLREVHSKPQALSQCRRWLSDHLPGVQLVEASSSVAAAQLAAEKPGVAAVASLEAAREHDLDVLAQNIEDNPNNVTRFAVLGHLTPSPTGDDKTSLICQVKHEPGALADLMMTFKNKQLNLTWIESFPIPGKPSEYFFFIEFDGHQDDALVAEALGEVRKNTHHFQLLGSYPKAPTD